MGRDLGDFQTPPALVAAVLTRIGSRGKPWQRVLEPTCGRGNFLSGVLGMSPAPCQVRGIELQSRYLSEAHERLAQSSATDRCSLIQSNLFDLDLSALAWDDPEGPLLVVGNPPWVTNSEFGALQSVNRPPRSNVKHARGIDAITGGSNFDAAEAVWLKLLTELADQSPTIALLCKTSVARNVLEHARRLAIPLEFAEVIRLDARAWFEAAVEACLLIVQVGKPSASVITPLDRVPVFARLDETEPESFLGFARGQTVADADAYARHAWADGACALTWRQGVKHDAASVMELSIALDGGWTNKLGEAVDVEPEFVFPLLKGTDLSRPAPVEPRRAVIVTQRSVGHDTLRLKADAPRLWAYLQRHMEFFSRRKSSVYLKRPPFAMFGIGPYTFSPYKVGISGLHRRPVFRAIGPFGGRPVMLDDTGYFLPCDSAEQAALIATLLNGPEAIGLLASLTLPGSKRPVTKSLLRRVDLLALCSRTDRAVLLERAGLEVQRIADRPAHWSGPIERFLQSEGNQESHTPLIQELAGPWPSPPSIISAAH